MYEYSTKILDFMVHVDKVGGGTLGKEYDGDWRVTVVDGSNVIFDAERLTVGMPNSHHDVAWLAAEFASEGI